MRKLLSWTLKIGVTVGLLGYIFHLIPFAEVVDSVRSARLPLVALAFALGILQIYVSAARLSVLLRRQGLVLSLHQIAEINLVTAFYGFFMPSDLAAGAVRWHRLTRAGGKGAETFVSLAYGRLVFTSVLVAVGLAFLALENPRALLEAQGVILGAILLLLVAVYVVGSLSRTHQLASGLKLWTWLAKLFEATNRFRTIPLTSLTLVVAISVAENLVGILSVYWLAVALALPVTFVQIAWIRSLLMIVTLIPVSVSGLGVREGGLVVLLAPYAVPQAGAVALSFLLLGKIAFLASVGGISEVAKWLPARRSKHY